MKTQREGKPPSVPYISNLSLTSALDVGMSGQRLAAADLSPEKDSHYLIHTRLGGPQVRSGVQKFTSPLPGFEPRTVQLVASRVRKRSARK